MLETEDTIVAISTPPGRSGIGILRLSGPDAFRIASGLIQTTEGTLEPDRRLRLARVVDPQSGDMLDEVLVALMPEPKTYTRQDIVEIQAHGGPAVLGRLLDLALEAGARSAGPGEFTLRAYLNGRIDLAQAEAVASLVNSQSEGGAREAARQLAGGLSSEVNEMRDVLLAHLASLEAAIDFPEEELPHCDMQAMDRDLSAAESRCLALAATFKQGRILTHGATVAIVGKPNVGKSSLFNALLKRDRALVHHRPGTTRDVVEDRLELGGLPVTLADTAGLRRNSTAEGEDATDDPVELAGMERTRDSLDRADAALMVFDLSRPLDDHDRELWGLVQDRPVVTALNKIDLVESQAADDVIGELKPERCSITSAKTGVGIAELAEMLGGLIIDAADVATADSILISRRHADAVRQAAMSLDRARKALADDMSAEFVAYELRDAVMTLGRIVGRFGQRGSQGDVEEDLLDSVFSNFCIGK